MFGIPGIQIYGIVAAIRDEPGIRMITTRHEQATTYMADGYARASGKPGVALVVPGVGLYNAASGLTNAYSRSTPVLLIAGQIPRGAIGKNRGAVHEIADQAGAVRSVTKWQGQASRPREVPDAVSEAFRQMRTGRPRPALLEIPPEVGVEREDVEIRSPVHVSRIVPSREALKEAAQVVARSRLPLIYAGAGWRDQTPKQRSSVWPRRRRYPSLLPAGARVPSPIDIRCPTAPASVPGARDRR